MQRSREEAEGASKTVTEAGNRQPKAKHRNNQPGYCLFVCIVQLRWNGMQNKPTAARNANAKRNDNNSPAADLTPGMAAWSRT
jgi:hypothetical protein